MAGMAETSDEERKDENRRTIPIQDTNNGSEETKDDNNKQDKQSRVNTSTYTPTNETNEDDLPDVTTFEDILEILGTRGRWNLMIFLLCGLTNIVESTHVISYQFLGATPDHWCHVEPLHQAAWSQEQILNFAIPMGKEGKREGCFMYDYNYTKVAELGYEEATASSQDTPALVPCYSRDFNLSQYQSTVTTEWDLVCERRALYSTTQGAVQLGHLIGYIFIGYLTDKFGRRNLVVLFAALGILTTFGSAVASSLELYIFFRVAINVATSGAHLAAYVQMLESFGNRDRAKVGIIVGVFWALGYMAVSGAAYYIRTWKWLQAALSLPGLMQIIFIWVFPESPRWLVMKGRHEEALKVLKKAAATNGRTLPPDQSLLAAMERLHAKASIDHETAAAGEKMTEDRSCASAGQCVVNVVKQYLTVLIVKEVRPRALILFFCWFAVSLVYYGISLSATNISANIYLYIFLGGVAEIIGYSLLCLFVAYLGRVKSLVLLYLICGVFILILALLVSLFAEAPTGLLMFFSLTGKMAITAAYMHVFFFTPELFPTKYRSLAMSQANVAATVGSIASPYINDLLGDLVVWAPSALFCIISSVAAGLASFLPETKGRGMSEGCTSEEEPDGKGQFTRLTGQKQNRSSGKFLSPREVEKLID